jgi:hypothetical protein
VLFGEIQSRFRLIIFVGQNGKKYSLRGTQKVYFGSLLRGAKSRRPSRGEKSGRGNAQPELSVGLSGILVFNDCWESCGWRSGESSVKTEVKWAEILPGSAFCGDGVLAEQIFSMKFVMIC